MDPSGAGRAAAADPARSVKRALVLATLLASTTLVARARAQDEPPPPPPAEAPSTPAPEPPPEPTPQPIEPAPAPAPPEPLPPEPPLAVQKPPSDDVVISGSTIGKVSGSAHVLRKDQLDRFEYDDPGATLQQVPGVYVRGEDGMGLRPNLGIRGANPDRSKKLTLMEDGILIGPAPYSAPAAYYFPLITRMTQVRVIKGPAAIAYGPQTVGGAIDFISRPIPSGTHGAVDLAAGEYGYNKQHVWFGSSDEAGGREGSPRGQWGFLVEGVRIQNTGFTELPSGADTGSTRNDWMFKTSYTLDPNAKTTHNFQLKLSYADEVSNETYLGQSDADFRENPYRRYPASMLDQMKNHRTGVVVTHTMEGPRSEWTIKTSVYRFDYQRSWNKFNRMGAASGAAILENPDDPQFAGYYRVLRGQIDSGSPADQIYVGPNNRTFVNNGIQSVLTTSTKTGPVDHAFEMGVRWYNDQVRRVHTESAYLMQGGTLVSAEQPILTTADNRASSHAFAVHMTDAISWKSLTVTPGARVEVIASRNEDYLLKKDDERILGAVMPGIGAFYEIVSGFGALAGVYRGFSPPAPGSNTQVKPEYSVNYETGIRYSKRRTRAELIGFFNDYSNLTDVCSLASGCVTVNLDQQFDAGRARIYGLEASSSVEPRAGDYKFPITAAYTLTQGELLNDFTSADPIYGVVRRGYKLPYIPLHQWNVTAAVEHRIAGLNAAVTYVAPMRERASDDPLAQSLVTDDQTWADFGGYVAPFKWLRFYANLRNAFNAQNIVGRRPYGARVNAPRWLQVGLKAEF